METGTAVSRAAIAYAVAELARRAGVAPSLSRTWRIDCAPDAVTVWVQPGTKKSLRFPRCRLEQWSRIQAGEFRVSIADWPFDPQGQHFSIPNFPVPFSTSSRNKVGPLFVADGLDSFWCPVDLPLSVLLTLSRFEETQPGPRDKHGRFSAFSSVAWRGGFLDRPIVDEYGLALEQALHVLLPGWQAIPRALRVKLGHDVDEIGIPFSFRSAVAHTVVHGHPLHTVRDLAAPVTRIDTTYQMKLRHLVQWSVERDLASGVYWKASRRGPFDTGYDLRDGRIARLISEFREHGIEMGMHPSYFTFESPDLLEREVQTLRELLGERSLGGRQDYLRWSPQTWIDWDTLGISYDESVGFADCTGFRAGTCHPYRPWLWSQQRQASLVEIPLIAMDSTLQGYLGLTPQEALARLRDCVSRCRAVGGVFTLAWHNTRILNAGYARTYQTLLDDLRGSARYRGGEELNNDMA